MAATIRLRTGQFRKFALLKGWRTQADMAKALGLAESTVYRVFSGLRAPGPQFIAAVMQALSELDFDDLFEVVDESADPAREARSA